MIAVQASGLRGCRHPRSSVWQAMQALKTVRRPGAPPTPSTRASVASDHHRVDRFSRCHAPAPDEAVRTAGEDFPTIGRERQRPQWKRRPGKLARDRYGFLRSTSASAPRNPAAARSLLHPRWLRARQSAPPRPTSSVPFSRCGYPQSATCHLLRRRSVHPPASTMVLRGRPSSMIVGSHRVGG